jgi:hypothetical protein
MALMNTGDRFLAKKGGSLYIDAVSLPSVNSVALYLMTEIQLKIHIYV